MKDYKPGKQPYVNYYQYPPLEEASIAESRSLGKRLFSDRGCSDPTYGLYVSVPFCRSRCFSCHFFKNLLPPNVDKRAFLDAYLEDMFTELRLSSAYKKRYEGKRCGAIYFGGGTASLLEVEQVDRILGRLKSVFDFDDDIEITLEGNPSDFTLEYLKSVKERGINRVSVGFQSNAKKVLKALNTVHDQSSTEFVLENIIKAGFTRLNADLLFGVPGQEKSDCDNAVSHLMSLGVPSIKIYSYVVHKDSASDKMIKSNVLDRPVDADTAYGWYLDAKKNLESNGYVEGRRGSFAKVGYRQRYGSIVYDNGYELVGLGAGSYSYINRTQFASPKSYKAYRWFLSDNVFPPADRISRTASDGDLMRRFVIFNLFSFRVDNGNFKRRFGCDIVDAFPKAVESLTSQGIIEMKGGSITFPEHGRRYRNYAMYQFYDTNSC